MSTLYFVIYAGSNSKLTTHFVLNVKDVVSSILKTVALNSKSTAASKLVGVLQVNSENENL